MSKKTKKNRVRWGFIWVFLVAAFWGLGYVPLQLAWFVPPFIDGPVTMDESSWTIMASVIISATQALLFTIILLILWTAVTGKLKDYVRTIRNFKITKWFLVGCIFGGPIAILGSMIATGAIGAQFAAAMGLMSTVVGAIVGRIVNKEKLSKKTILGLLLIVVGGVVILNPAVMIEEISSGGSAIGYIGAIMSAIGWGLEGNFVSRALDVTDSDSSVVVRYSMEALVWFVIVFPITIALFGMDNFGTMFSAAYSNVDFLFWVGMAGMTLGMCYVMQYKGFPLLGVGRTLAIGSLYVPVSVVALFVFLGIIPDWTLIVGVVLAVVGTFVMYWESDSLEDSMRDTGGA
ncbi:DMT family transporter [Methanomassiliicoccales archaeon LGM-RCC1]|nr:DMT family transporter [Methanomassiliicoccales archaeon LGM-RCC1]